MQFSRGCPFTCEFCDIIELYGRVPRAKTNAQMLAELDALHRLGYRGHVDFVDDNLIGNKKAVKASCPIWRTGSSSATIRSSSPPKPRSISPTTTTLLRLLSRANFVGVFVGIESPDPATLMAMRKKQNTRRNIAESIHRLYGAGLFVTAGFIVGFDSETGSVADGMVELIEEAAIPVCMVGLLYALPQTQLTRRLEREGRLHPTLDELPTREAPTNAPWASTSTPLRPRPQILADYMDIVQRIYEPKAYAGRLRRLAAMLDTSGRPQRTGPISPEARSATWRLQRFMTNLPEPRDLFRRTLGECRSGNPSVTRAIVFLIALYLHLGPFSRVVLARIEAILDELRDGVDQRHQSGRSDRLADPDVTDRAVLALRRQGGLPTVAT